MTRAAACAALLLAAWPARPAGATGFTDLGDDLRGRPETQVELDGSLRLRGEALTNLDLDRGLDPSGRPLFPVPVADPTAQTLTHGDLRLRSDVAVYAPGGGVALKLRVDVLDGLALGSDPEGAPQASATQRPPAQAFRIKRAYGEALTPIGLLVAGRVGNTWGLGILANGGDCADCDSGDAADRIAFVTPLFGHIFGFAYDFSATGPQTLRRDERRALDLEPSDDVHTVTFAALSWKSDMARRRRARAGKITVEYGAYASYRWQENDVPATYLPVAGPMGGFDATDIMYRGFSAFAVDGWFRITTPRFRLEAEAALVLGTVEQPSLVPGVLLPDPVESRQIGAALESEVGGEGAAFVAGLDLGFASGDPAPGFGAFVAPGAAAGTPGDLEAPQAEAPGDLRVDNFRFHPDYRVDRILFREIIGTVTDAVYVRPHAAWRGRLGRGVVSAQLALIASAAVEAASTPGGKAPLGVELDPTLVYESDDGFQVGLEYALLLPLAGLDNPVAGLDARPAQLWRVRLAYLF